ncbi:MAG TPA: hypothetical protein VFS34_07720 [Thermoanaerobaculia bacterium]|nr:hypothetical protein [Thermoanaerobaculia bacterium]
MSSAEKLSCAACGKEGIIYMHEGSPYCPSCLSKKRPPLRYTGPERRRRQVPTMYLRREGDFKGKKPAKG